MTEKTTILEISEAGECTLSGPRMIAEYAFIKSIEWFYQNHTSEPKSYRLEIYRRSVFEFDIVSVSTVWLKASVAFCPLSCAIWTFERRDGSEMKLSECTTVGECLGAMAQPDLTFESWTSEQRVA